MNSLRLKRAIPAPRQALYWPLRDRPPFMTSELYKGLRRDLERYCDDEVTGRSYLIAGHRGSGKTAVVLRAIQDLWDDRLQASLHLVAASPGAVGLRRPLLVRLHGPSLADPLPPTKAEKDAKVAPAARPAAAVTPPKPAVEPGADPADADAGQVPPAQNGATAESAAVDKASAGAALAHITIALYRALAHEISIGYGANARACGVRRNVNGEELAAQLRLELDTGPEPSVLRTFWDRIDRRVPGILWPKESDETLKQLRVTDQGLREIVALATAAQAYQVCIGAVSYAETSADSDFEKSATEGKDNKLNEIIARLGTVGLGALTGGGIAAADPNSSVPAIGAGVLVWLLGNVSLTWNYERRRSRHVTGTYSFVRDRAVQTLDRDLPLVIERIRQTGLAPVFVIDELDKLDDPKTTIGNIIKFLKHIIADFGFFCFLTDREYFDQIEKVVADEAFPKEHTYFSERRLLAYTPGQYFRFLVENLTSDAIGTERQAGDDPDAYRNGDATSGSEAPRGGASSGPSASAGPPPQEPAGAGSAAAGPMASGTVTAGSEGSLVTIAEATGQDVDAPVKALFALYVVHSGKLNFTGVNRTLSKLLGDDGVIKLSREQLFGRTDIRLAACVQLAIEEILGGPKLALRLEDDASFTQLAFDSLYSVSRAWEEDHAEFDSSRKVLQSELEKRVNDSKASPNARWTPNADDLSLLEGELGRLVGLLCDFKALREAVTQREAASRLEALAKREAASKHAAAAEVPPAPEYKLADIIPLSTLGLLTRSGPRGTKYRFLYDRYGRDDRRVDRVEVANLISLIDAMRQLLSARKITFEHLAAAGLLPSTLSATVLQRTRRALQQFVDETMSDDEVRAHLTPARELREILAERGAKLSAGLVLARKLGLTAGEQTDLRAALLVLGRYPVLGPAAATGDWSLDTWAASRTVPFPSLETDAVIGPDETSIIAFAKELDAISAEPLAEDGQHDAWAAWKPRIEAFLAGGAVADNISFDDLVDALLQRGPSALLSADLERVTLASWSRLSLAALRPGGHAPPRAPRWALVAGLRALGFEARVVRQLAEERWPEGAALTAPEAREAQAMLRAVRRGRQGLLVVTADGQDLGPPGADKRARRPQLHVYRSEFSTHQLGLAWLLSLDAFSGLAMETDGL